MIEPTDEMRIIVLGWRSRYGALADDVLTELFAIVERDYDLRPRPTLQCSRPGCGHIAAQHRDSCVGDLMFCPCPTFMRDPEPGQPEPGWHVGCTWCWRTAWHTTAQPAVALIPREDTP